MCQLLFYRCQHGSVFMCTLIFIFIFTLSYKVFALMWKPSNYKVMLIGILAKFFSDCLWRYTVFYSGLSWVICCRNIPLIVPGSLESFLLIHLSSLLNQRCIEQDRNFELYISFTNIVELDLKLFSWYTLLCLLPD